MKIVVIQHENDFSGEGGNYFIEVIADCWRKSGHEVVFVNGMPQNITADIALLHVNLSVVPVEYINYAKQFPKRINLDITDIRKRTISQNLVDQNDSYNGSVIVKTDLNSAGIPESIIFKKSLPKGQFFMSSWRSCVRKGRNGLIKLKLIDNTASRLVQTEYRESFRIFTNKNDVPKRTWLSEDWIVEKFLPETENSVYITRNAYFFGNTTIGFKDSSSDPIVKDTEGEGELIEIPESIKQFRLRIGLDYGKIDYVMQDDKPVVLDITKTVGGAYARHIAEILAPGLEDYFVAQKKPA